MQKSIHSLNKHDYLFTRLQLREEFIVTPQDTHAGWTEIQMSQILLILNTVLMPFLHLSHKLQKWHIKILSGKKSDKKNICQ